MEQWIISRELHGEFSESNGKKVSFEYRLSKGKSKPNSLLWHFGFYEALVFCCKFHEKNEGVCRRSVVPSLELLVTSKNERS